MRLLTIAAVAALGAAGLAAPASATQVYVSNMGLNDGYDMVSFQQDPAKPAGPWGGGTEYTGRQTLTANYGNTDDPAQQFSIFAWCIDVFHDINIGANSIVYTLGPAIAPEATNIRKLAAWGDQQLGISTPNALISAAVQAEIWDLEYNVEIVPGSNPTLEAEVDYLGTLLPELLSATGAALSGFNSQGGIAQTLYNGNVPEPGTLALLVAGLVAAGLVRGTRRRPNAKATW